MNKFKPILIILLAVAVLLAIWKSTSPIWPSDASAEIGRGPHGGRFFGGDDFQCEVTIYEPEGVTPEFHVYFYKDGEPLDPANVQLTITLERINRTEVVQFKKQGDYLIGDKDVVEPHSFHAKVQAQYDGKVYDWKFDSIEGRTELQPEIVSKAGVEMLKAGPAEILETVNLRGRVALNEDRTSRAVPRFPGIIKAVNKNFGDPVQKGEILAVIESNNSFSTYQVRSEISGTVIKRDATLGEFVEGQQTLFVISDLSAVWVDLIAHRLDFPLLKVGQPVSIDAGDGAEPIESKLSYLSPVSSQESQTMLARCVVANQNGILRPGAFVSGTVTVEQTQVPVAVKASALQTFRDWDVVFVRVGNLFEAVPIEIGKQDAQWVEIKKGLPLGSEYAADNSFIIKADVMKSGATHDH